MRKVIFSAIGILMVLILTACSGQQQLANMELVDMGGKSAIIWDGRTYYPFCVVSKGDRGEQIGYVNGDKEDRISAYQGYSPEEWLVSWLPMDGGAMLYKEEDVTDIPDGLVSEYD